MSEYIWCACGALLVEEVTEEGVRPVGGDELVLFRRATDYVMCPSCLRTYDVRSLAARARDSGVIESLERLAQRIPPE